MNERIEEVQSANSIQTNLSIQQLIGMIDQACIEAAQTPSIGVYSYIYALLDRIYLKVYMILDSEDNDSIVRHKKVFDSLYLSILERASTDEDPEETSPTLGELYRLRACVNGINAAIYKGLQRKKYFFSTRGGSVSENKYYDPVLDSEVAK